MPETDKQEGQKTVVAFIAGLLIGGLLVWVFSSSPESTPVDEQSADDTEDTTTDSRTSTDTRDSSQTSTVNNATNNTSGQTANGTGVLEVANQPAGSTVELSSVVFPTAEGWVVVRDLIDGTPGRILGAARYHQEVGLVPESVTLLRATEAGKTYEVVFYSENGDRVFDLSDDLEMEDGDSASFTAQ